MHFRSLILQIFQHISVTLLSLEKVHLELGCIKHPMKVHLELGCIKHPMISCKILNNHIPELSILYFMYISSAIRLPLSMILYGTAFAGGWLFLRLLGMR